MARLGAPSFWDRLPARFRWLGLGAALGLSVSVPLAVVSCCSGTQPSVSSPLETGSEEAAIPRAKLALLRPADALEKPEAQDALWVSAAAEDPLDLGRLAAREGGGALVEVASRGGKAGVVALAALPFALDAPALLGPLCALLGGAASDVELVIPAVFAVAQRPVPEEVRDAEGRRSCILGLKAQVESRDLSLSAKDLAQAAAKRLEDTRGEP